MTLDEEWPKMGSVVVRRWPDGVDEKIAGVSTEEFPGGERLVIWLGDPIKQEEA